MSRSLCRGAPFYLFELKLRQVRWPFRPSSFHADGATLFNDAQ
jgi:hypothetical protein